MKYHISKENYFMSLAFLSAKRSKDPNTQVGAVIVNPKNRIIGMGYNGFPNGCKDYFPWNREGDFLQTKYPYVVHAEVNAIMNATGNLENSTLYCTLHPCNECAKIIAQAGIKKVVYYYNTYKDLPATKAAAYIFYKTKIETEQYKEKTLEYNSSRRKK